ncbi:hypothetical protein HMPREF0201_02598 [Cedecea davisae DSM 4568]|uniref:Uncharacterized protein n=1 Tax=Cedecea davisae DSM 4568 TaxID=566551 RepID=S3IR49_9ENTR|nr:hypothetical protein HMPREF0201_02598 [Cedecea davisae DSM 4568]
MLTCTFPSSMEIGYSPTTGATLTYFFKLKQSLNFNLSTIS